jgi:hypothetical protein
MKIVPKVLSRAVTHFQKPAFGTFAQEPAFVPEKNVPKVLPR